MDDAEVIKIWEEKHKRIEKIGKNRRYVLLFQIITSVGIVVSVLFDVVDGLFALIMIFIVLAFCLVLNFIIYKKISRIINEPMKGME